MQIFDSGSRALLRQLKAHKAPVHVARFAADQLHVLSGGDDGMVATWDVTSGQQVSRCAAAAGAFTRVGPALKQEATFNCH